MRNQPLPGLKKCPKCGKSKSECKCDSKKSPTRKSSAIKDYKKGYYGA